MDKKVLILVPSENARGGITNYYHTLSQFFTINIIYQFRGSRTFPYKKSTIREFIRIITDILKFVILIQKNVGLVQTTTSLYPNAVKRDAIFLILTKLFKKKTIVFFRGWDDGYAEEIKNNMLFKSIYLKSDAIIVLKKEIERKLISWGYSNKIYNETTVVDENLTQCVTESELQVKYNNLKGKIKLLFLARLERPKGIYELIDTLEILNTKYSEIELTIAGDGREEDKLKAYIASKNIRNIKFTGFVSNQKKVDVFTQNHIFVFPSYTEGMPTSVLEAMAFGLPVVTTAVGGLVDFFKEKINGYIIPSPDPQLFASKIETLLNNPEEMLKISFNNFFYAKNRFMSSQVAERNLEIFKQVIGNSNS